MAVFSSSFNGSVAIPDNNPTGITNVLAISGVPTGAFLSQIRVTLNITHTFDGDLDIFLIDPDGNQIELSTDNGGAEDNYSFTTFTDDAGYSISDAASGVVAPFPGPYRPEQALSLLVPGVVNGNWSLKIVDDANIDTGTLTNWSIDFLFGEASQSFVDGGTDRRSTVSASRDGRYSVSWNNNSNNGNLYNVIYDVFGGSTGANLSVGENLPPSPNVPFEGDSASTFLRNGGHALAYVLYSGGLQPEIRLRIDTGLSFETNVGTFAIDQTGDQYSPMIAELSNGNLIVAYVNEASASMTLQGRIFDTTTNTFGAAVTLSAGNIGGTVDETLQPAELIALSGGGFAVSYLGAGGGRVRVFDNNATIGSTTGATAAAGAVGVPALVQLLNGELLTIGHSAGASPTLTLGHFASNGVLLSTTSGISLSNIPAGEFQNLRATVLLDGRVMVVGSTLVENGTFGSDIWGLVIDASGSLDGLAFKINSDRLAGTQSAPDIATLADGRVVVTWTDTNVNNGDMTQQIIDLRAAGVTLTGFGSLSDDWMGSRFGDIMNGGLGNDVLRGQGGEDQLNGGDGIDQLNGDDGADILNGGNDLDVMAGGAGADQLFGGEGSDTLYFDALDTIVDGGAGYDTAIKTDAGSGVGYDMVGHSIDVLEWIDIGTTGNRTRAVRFSDGTIEATTVDLNGSQSSFLQRTLGYTAAWQWTSRDVLADGPGSNRVYTRFDPLLLNDWVQIDDYSSGGSATAQTGYYDDNRSWSATFNLPGNDDYIYTYKTASNVDDYKNGRFDDGRTWLLDYDQANADNTWSYKYAVNDSMNRPDYEYGYRQDDDTKLLWVLEHDQEGTNSDYLYQYVYRNADGITADYAIGKRDNGDDFYINY